MTNDLLSLGWTDELADQFRSVGSEDSAPGRVCRVDRSIATVITEHSIVRATRPGREFQHGPANDQLAVGDWVVLDGDRVTTLLPRATTLARASSTGAAVEQVLAANVDVVVVVVPLDTDLRLSKLERYLAFAWASGAVPVVALSKADQREDLDGAVAGAARVAVGVRVHPVSAREPNGLDPLLPYVSYGRTAALVGPSGAGKSTIVSALSGDSEISTGPVRSDGKGRHTTTWRELVRVPGGGALLDTPGLRGLALWDAADGVDAAFSDISELTQDCRFADCTHATEPGCAVHAAIASGNLSDQRLAGYRKMLREQAWIGRRHDSRAKAEATAQIRKVRRAARQTGPRRGS